ncbi:hypothetical protein [Vibrio parahaemolyticus]|uniref:hypothetical protein n=1 Tax=Vibrio parahaemolyticus TaxID=670 RepID=UPI000E32C366|nr:hypothetical protein [Vibrio parahaemolyticus]MCI4894674.1 hypothetical protein [Vibrio parahaemolyticus]MEA5356294.1 hypothetical protein [Vibrio parahaemolyticus]RFD37884.1 hypothetical protein BS585_15630 [Vibrio parahaemolyticus]HAT8517392.1 hypothetical protein [Vibrio vulnificus]
MNKIKLIFLSLAIGSAYMIPVNVSAADAVPKRPSVCKTESKAKIKKYIEKQEQSCETEYGIDTKNKAEDSDYWSNSDDANCDLGLKFPSLPGFDLDISALNACEIAQAVTENVVGEVNKTTQDAVDNITENVTGDKDGLDLDVDPNDTVVNEMEQRNVAGMGN